LDSYSCFSTHSNLLAEKKGKSPLQFDEEYFFLQLVQHIYEHSTIIDAMISDLTRDATDTLEDT